MIRSGIGFDAHRFSARRPLVLGGVSISGTNGLEGHSDADVLCHAIMDAMLGAVADGDIGCHFPDTDERWRNARSLDLLGLVKERLASLNARVLNVDATVIAETPKLKGHIPQMCSSIAEAIDAAARSVSVKATTVEGMGALGRREGIAALAIVSVEVGHEAP